MSGISPVCQPRDPQTSKYYQYVENNFETLEQTYDEWFSKQYGFFRAYVKQVIYRYLDCGDLHNGFADIFLELFQGPDPEIANYLLI